MLIQDSSVYHSQNILKKSHTFKSPVFSHVSPWIKNACSWKGLTFQLWLFCCCMCQWFEQRWYLFVWTPGLGLGANWRAISAVGGPLASALVQALAFVCVGLWMFGKECEVNRNCDRDALKDVFIHPGVSEFLYFTSLAAGQDYF